MLVLDLSSFAIQHAVECSNPSFLVWLLWSVSCLNQPPVPLRTDTPQSPQFSHQSPSATDSSPIEVGPRDHARASLPPPPQHCTALALSLQLSPHLPFLPVGLSLHLDEDLCFCFGPVVQWCLFRLYLLVTAPQIFGQLQKYFSVGTKLVGFQKPLIQVYSNSEGLVYENRVESNPQCHLRLGCRPPSTLLWLVFNPEPRIKTFCTNGWISVLSPLLLPQLGGDLGGSPAVSNVPDFIHLCLLCLMAHQYFACWLTDGGWFWCSTSCGAPGVQCPCERWPWWPLWPWRWSWHAHGSVQPSKNSEFWVGRRHLVKWSKKTVALRTAWFFPPPLRFGSQPWRLKVWKYLGRLLVGQVWSKWKWPSLIKPWV